MNYFKKSLLNLAIEVLILSVFYIIVAYFKLDMFWVFMMGSLAGYLVNETYIK
jgi:hypothetical protein